MNIIINDLNINYSKNGNGQEVLLLLHGWGSNIVNFKHMIESTSRYNTVYALDMPGFGQSDEPKQSWRVDDYVDLVIQFIQKMNIDKLSILGHSFGGRVIIKMISRDLPFDIDKVVLVDSAGIKPKGNNKNSLKVKFFKCAKKIVSLGLVRKIFPDALEDLKKKFGSADYKNATPIMRETLVKTVNEDLTHLLPNITQDTLLIWGDKDTATPISDAKQMEELIPNGKLITVKNAGHYSFLEQPYLVNKVIETFLKGKE